MTTFPLEITDLAYGGAGIGRHQGKVCFVSGTAPGDQVLVRVVREKKGYCEGEPLEILAPSALRADPVCPWFGRCGGCSWQHLSSSAQLRAKEDILRGFLQRLDPDAAPMAAAASPNPFGYRNRVQLKVRRSGDGVALGFYRRGSHYVIDIGDGCPLASPFINTMIPGLRSLLDSFPANDRIPQVDAVHGDDGRVHLTFHVLAGVEGQLADFIGQRLHLFATPPGGIHLQSGRKESLRTLRGENRLTYDVPADAGSSLSLSFTADGFSQVNGEVNRLLVRHLLDITSGEGGGGVLLDLCCGNGNLSLPLARRFDRVEGIEGYSPSIDSARRNARENGIGNCRFQVGLAEDFPALVADIDRVTMALLDPPREGARQAAEHLAVSAIPRIVYVSCDPSTLARDGAILRRGGYRLRCFRVFDMFPQTYHIETLALFERDR